MKDKLLYFILFGSVLVLSSLIIFLSFFLSDFSLEGIGEKGIHGFASSGAVSLNVGGDTTSPNVSITFPEPITYSSQVTVLNYTITGDTFSTLTNCWYSLDGGINTSVSCGSNVSGISSVEGTNQWFLYVNDTSGNIGFDNVTFLISLPAVDTPDGGGGGGGGGAPLPILTTIPKEFNLVVISGRSESFELLVRNNGDNLEFVDLIVEGLEGIVSLDKEVLTLRSKEKGKVVLFVNSPDEGIHSGKILLKVRNAVFEVPILINVQSEGSLFDISLTVVKKDKKIFLNQELKTFISIVPIADAPHTDAEIIYFIRNLDGDIVFLEGEKRTIIEKEGFVKIFLTSGFEMGEYIVGMEMTYPDGFASSSDYFEVVDIFLAPLFNSIFLTLILALFSLIIIIIVILIYLKVRRDIKK